MAVSKKRKKVLFIVVALLIILILCSFFGVYMLRKNSEQIQDLIKNKVSSDVMKREAELSEVITEISSQEVPRCVHLWMKDEDTIPFKELGNDKVTKVFKEFFLLAIQNHLDNSEGGYVTFAISSNVAYLLWGDYGYGFYYSEEDSPIDIFTGESNVDCNTKVHNEFMPSIEYWYRTEKITDNWWYYETQWTYNTAYK